MMETPLEIFNQGIRNLSLISVSGRKFVLTKRLKLWLNTFVDDLGTQTVLESLFNTVVANEVSGNLITPPWKSDSVLVFCILLQLNSAHLLQELDAKGISDRLRPIEKQDLRAFSQNLSHFDERLADEFFEIQWQYCAASFDLDGVYEWPREMIIPIYAPNMIAEGRTAKVYEVAIPEEFISPGLRHAFPHCSYEDSNISPGWIGPVLTEVPSTEWETEYPKKYYRFALKTFDRWNTDLWKREIAVFQNMGSHEGLVRPLAAFKSTEIQPSSTAQAFDESRGSYNILFECCEMDLGNYFASMDPPVTPRDIEGFWTNLIEVVAALRHLHGASQDIDINVDTKIQKQYIGYHHDIKPSNILLSGGHFKLSDFGFASFGPIEDAYITSPGSFGTVSYGPPEPNIYTIFNLTLESFQKFDLWSVGCVLSEAATWVVLGYSGISKFSTLRRRVLDKICTEREKKEPEVQSNISVNIPRRGDYFHDATDVLAIVTSWHRFLRSSVRRSDTISSKVLDIVDQGLLVSDIKGRLHATTLYVQLKQCIEKGGIEASLLPDNDTEIEEFLREEESPDSEEDVAA